MSWWYLSFADADGFRGGVILLGESVQHAAMRAWALGANPGGEVLGGVVPEEKLPPHEFRNRLLSYEEIKSFWPDVRKAKELLN